MSYHGYAHSHIDALCHILYKDQTYNGYARADVNTEKGCTKLGIENLKNGIVTRGMLIDIPRLKNVPYLEPGTPVYVEDLEAWEKKVGREGRRRATRSCCAPAAGRAARSSARGTSAQNAAGFHASVVAVDQGSAASRSSAATSREDVTPSLVEGVSLPVHTLLITALGINLLDNQDLEAVARDRREAESLGVHADDRAGAGDRRHRIPGERAGDVLTNLARIACAGAVICATLRCVSAVQVAGDAAPVFDLVQPDLFSANGGSRTPGPTSTTTATSTCSSASAAAPNRLYRNDRGRFADVAAAVGLADNVETRAAAWGDFDGDGHVDLYVGFTGGDAQPSCIATTATARISPTSRAALGVDVDRRDAAGRRGSTTTTTAISICSSRSATRRTVLFRNDGGRFTDVAKELGRRRSAQDRRRGLVRHGRRRRSRSVRRQPERRHQRAVSQRRRPVRRRRARAGASTRRGRPADFGSVGPSVADFDNDGLLDLFVAELRTELPLPQRRRRRFIDVARRDRAVVRQHATTPSRGATTTTTAGPISYVAGFLRRPTTHYPDHLFHNERRQRFSGRAAGARQATHDATHGVQWVDFDGDGALDLALANNDPTGGHYLFRNLLPADRARQSLAVDVVDEHGRHTQAGRGSARLRGRHAAAARRRASSTPAAATARRT